MNENTSSDIRRREPADIIAEALDRYKPVAIYAGFSGGNGSRPAVHWAMNNVPGCEVMHLNTGIGIEAGRQYVRDTCKAMGWPLREIRTSESYDDLVRQYGFPGPDGHALMYQRLKERAVWDLMRQAKKGHKRSAKVLFITGIRHADSIVRTGYAGREVNKYRGQVWANPLYWWTNDEMRSYDASSGMPRNQIADALGMSGECGCGAFAQRGELKRWEAVDPSFGVRIRGLEAECLARGFTWGWEGGAAERRAQPCTKHARPATDAFVHELREVGGCSGRTCKRGPIMTGPSPTAPTWSAG